MKKPSFIFSIILGVSLLSITILPVIQSAYAEMIDLEKLDYEITGGVVSSFETDSSMRSLIVILQSDSDGQLTITLPRTFIDAIIGNVDDDFFVISDGEEIIPEEISTTSEYRTFVIPFNAGTEEIELIGTMINVSALDSTVEPQTVTETPEPVPIQTQDNTEGGGCLIATATYGSELAPQVQQLREIRDNSLLQTESGTSFMNVFNGFYYSFSPIIADYERENSAFKETVKLVITPMISSLSILNQVEINSEADMLGYGISLILLNVGMYVGVPIAVIVMIRKNLVRTD